VFGLGANDCSGLSNTIDVIADMIPQTGHDADFVLFPNPAEEKITLVWDGRHPLESIGVYDLTGKCLKLEYVANPKSEFSLEGIAPQFLMIVCTDTNGEIYLRPIVKR
ncbi:MAG: hypothetical protein JNM00_14135, partial [Flavobacteriales bacterium]|nr:hypothetical protein [Flavobacteriales bacterium]